MLLQVSDCESFDYYKRDWISGESRCETPQCWVRGQCLGQTLDLDIVANEDACLAWCESKSGCNWFTFYTPAAECILFKTCPAIDGTCSDCISGESSCAPHFGPSGIPLAPALEIKISRIRLFVRNLENWTNGGEKKLLVRAKSQQRELGSWSKQVWSAWRAGQWN